ncbi:bacillithiol system redox-active protein YtxJ [Flavobacterium sp.]|uniref:bacillithiol system redox-active protein YtxJ n=1 Tax=Flavobacterium sp. TaxID=239 RepID=UPI0025E26D12|nr:bacillithiol system redox-active protein YtxJ [Flavobacterium sp.]
MGFFNSTSNASNQSLSKVGWRQLTDLGQLNEIVSESTDMPVLIFKHSTRCGVSRMILKQFENEFDLHEEITPYFLDILAYRSLSNEIANRFEVVHQSPQLIVIKDGKAVYNDSHESLDASQLEQFI